MSFFFLQFVVLNITGTRLHLSDFYHAFCAIMIHFIVTTIPRGQNRAILRMQKLNVLEFIFWLTLVLMYKSYLHIDKKEMLLTIKYTYHIRNYALINGRWLFSFLIVLPRENKTHFFLYIETFLSVHKGSDIHLHEAFNLEKCCMIKKIYIYK